MASKKKPVVTQSAIMQLKYMREIMRQATLCATVPKPRTFKGVFDMPTVVMERMVVVLSGLLKQALDSLKTRVAFEKRVEKRSEGKSKPQIEMIRIEEGMKDWAKLTKRRNS